MYICIYIHVYLYIYVYTCSWVGHTSTGDTRVCPSFRESRVRYDRCIVLVCVRRKWGGMMVVLWWVVSGWEVETRLVCCGGMCHDILCWYVSGEEGETRLVYCVVMHHNVLCWRVVMRHNVLCWHVSEEEGGTCWAYCVGMCLWELVWLRACWCGGGNLVYHIGLSLVANMSESCHVHEWVMSHIWLSHVTYTRESYHVHEQVMSHICVSHVTSMNDSCHIYECFNRSQKSHHCLSINSNTLEVRAGDEDGEWQVLDYKRKGSKRLFFTIYFCMLRYLNTAIMPRYSYQDILTTDADLFLICSHGLTTSIVTTIASMVLLMCCVWLYVLCDIKIHSVCL